MDPKTKDFEHIIPSFLAFRGLEQAYFLWYTASLNQKEQAEHLVDLKDL
jgi:hypothetical protein